MTPAPGARAELLTAPPPDPDLVDLVDAGGEVYDPRTSTPRNTSTLRKEPSR